MAIATERTDTRRRTLTRSPLQFAALVVGAAFLLIGILGFIPGITANYGALTGAGRHSGALLLGLFNVSILHNLVHLTLGVAGLLATRTTRSSRPFLVGGGVVYLASWISGLVVDLTSSAKFIPVDDADNWLHLGLAVAMIALGLFLEMATGATPITESSPDEAEVD